MAFDQFQIALDGRERGAEFMGGIRRELPQAFKGASHSRQQFVEDCRQTTQLITFIADGQALADELGISKSTTSRVLALASIKGELLEVMKGAPTRFPYRLANELRLLAEERSVEKAVELAQAAASGDDDRISVRYVEELRRAPSAVGSTRSRENPRITTALRVGDRKAGAIKLFASGRVQMELSGLSPDVQELLHDKVREILETANAA